MGRLKELRNYVDRELLKVTDTGKRKDAYVHLYGVSLAATLISEKRGEETELACMAAMLHDLYAYQSGSYDDHGPKGAALAKSILDTLKLTSDKETEMICSAIYHHDDKAVVDAPFDELLKDADVMHHTMNDLSKPIKDKEKARYAKLRVEFGLK